MGFHSKGQCQGYARRGIIGYYAYRSSFAAYSKSKLLLRNRDLGVFLIGQDNKINIILF